MHANLIASRYELIAPLGEGGMAKVYRAKDTQSKHDVALKVMTESLLGDPEAQRRFKAEHRVMAALDHPGIPVVHALGLTAEGLPFFAMELVEGESLEHLAQLTPAEVVALASELLPILAHVHGRGLVHGDLKAENLMRTKKGALKLMDFGLAGPAGARPHGLEGTVTHLAPELIQRGKADQRSDLYAVGVILYRWLTGVLPFDGASAAETLKLHVSSTPAPPRKHDDRIPPELDALVMRLLAKRPQDRPQSAHEVLRALGVATTGEETLAIPLSGPFVGRGALMGEFLAQLGATAQGQPPRPMLLAGEPGLGKSRLLEELGAQGRLLDLHVASAQCPPDQTPFGPFIDLSRDLLALARMQAPPLADALQKALVPFTTGRESGADAASALKAAAIKLIEALASGRGLVVLLDDWHLADAASAGLFAELVKRTDKLPAFFVASATGPVTGVEFEVRTLEPLAPGEVAAMVASSLGVAEAPEAVVEQVSESTGGNPRFVEELVRYLLANRRLVHRPDGWALAEGAAGTLPSGLAALYGARVADMTEAARRLAETLATAISPLPAQALTRAAELTPEQAEEGLAELITRGIAAETASGVALADSQLSAYLLQQLGPEAMRDRHGAVADALLASSGDRPSVRVVNAIAHHGLEGPDPARYFGWIHAAARKSLELKALYQAKRFGRAALELAADLSERERLEILELLSSALRGLDDTEGALAVVEEAVGLATASGEPELASRALNGLGKVHQLASRYDEAKAAFTRAAEAAGEAAPLELARSHRALARLSFFAGDMDGTYQHGREALALVRRHAEAAERAEVLAEIGEMYQGQEDRLHEGLMCLEEAQALASELDNDHLLSTVAAGLGNLQLALGQLSLAKVSFQRAARLYESIGNAGEALFARLNLAIIAEEQGYFPEAERIASAVGAEAKAVNRKFPLAVALVLEGSSQVHQGRTAEGLKRLREGAEMAEAIQHEYLRAYMRQFEGPCRVLLGQFEAAQAEAEALIAFGTASKVSEMIHRGGLLLAEVAMAQGRLDEAAERLGELVNAGHAACRLHAQVLRAKLALTHGHEAVTHQALHAARSLAGEVDAPRFEGEFLLVEAELAVRAGEEAASYLEGAIKLLEATHQRHMLVLALAAQGRHGPAKERKAATSRALELLEPLASALGPDRGSYMAAFGRTGILASRPEEGNAPLAPVPNSIGGLKDLVRRLETGLAQLESQGLNFIHDDAAMTQRRLEQVVSFAKAVNSTLDIEQVIDRALSLVIEVTGAERGLLLLKEAGGLTSQRYRTAAGAEAQEVAGAEQYSRTVARTVIDTGETVCVLDALADSRFAQQASVMGMNLQTIICVPLKDQRDVIGAIYVDRQGLSDQFTESDLEIVQALAGLTAQAIVNARLMTQQRERQVHLEMLNRLSRTISRTLELDKVLDLIAEMTLEMTNAERCFVMLLEDEQLIFGAGRDQDGPLPALAIREISLSVLHKVVETQTGVCLLDAGRDAEFSQKRSVMNLKLGSIVAVPLTSQSGLAGVLYIDSRQRILGALEKEQAVLQSVGNTASLAIENAKLYRQATIDGLTGLYVRSFFWHRLNEEIRRSQRFGNRFSLLVMDIDHFKKFNDTYGHAIGDAVLRLVANTIKESVRVGLDLPCRYGGEEMIVLLPETDAAGAMITAERIRKAVETAVMPGPEGEALRVTISIGVASFPEMAGTGTELFERADQALYASKRNGRNRSTVFDTSLVPDL